MYVQAFYFATVLIWQPLYLLDGPSGTQLKVYQKFDPRLFS